MPLVSSTYCAPFPYRDVGLSGHLSTISPSLFRKVPPAAYQRTRLELPDHDFLDLDWLKPEQNQTNNSKLAILGHGLEGSSQAHYIRAQAHSLNQAGYDALAWNCRGCSGTDDHPEPNRLLRSYHSGVSEDLAHVVNHALTLGYQSIALVGFSLGGNIILKYLGEQGTSVPKEIKTAVAFSVPCDLTSSSLRLGEPQNKLYMARFMNGLKNKVRQKAKAFPGQLDLSDLKNVKSFADFDDRFTAPLNGFRNAQDYWTQASSKPHLQNIKVRTLLVQAQDDPFLAPPCFPTEIAQDHPHLHLEIPTNGGHVGFIQKNGNYYTEDRTLSFLETNLS